MGRRVGAALTLDNENNGNAGAILGGAGGQMLGPRGRGVGLKGRWGRGAGLQGQGSSRDKPHEQTLECILAQKTRRIGGNRRDNRQLGAELSCRASCRAELSIVPSGHHPRQVIRTSSRAVGGSGEGVRGGGGGGSGKLE